MPEPRGIDNVFIEVGDLDEAVAWYERIVGLTLKVRAQGMAVLDVGGDVAGIVLSSADPVSPTKVWVEVADAKDAASELGVPTFPIATGLTAEVVDPWGNRIGFTDYTARPDLARP
jgi:predicted enzyme related to lactoylglutathione lyase